MVHTLDRLWFAENCIFHPGTKEPISFSKFEKNVLQSSFPNIYVVMNRWIDTYNLCLARTLYYMCEQPKTRVLFIGEKFPTSIWDAHANSHAPSRAESMLNTDYIQAFQVLTSKLRLKNGSTLQHITVEDFVNNTNVCGEVPDRVVLFDTKSTEYWIQLDPILEKNSPPALDVYLIDVSLRHTILYPPGIKFTTFIEDSEIEDCECSAPSCYILVDDGDD